METKGFGKSLVFGALAALATTPFLLLARSLLGSGSAVALWSILLAAGYLAYVAPDRARGARVFFLALFLGLAVLSLASPSTTVLASAALVPVLRSGMLYRRRAARALAIESALLLVALFLVQLFTSAARGALPIASAVWAFFLVESLYFLMGGIASRRETGASEDPFERAARKAESLMEDWASTG